MSAPESNVNSNPEDLKPSDACSNQPREISESSERTYSCAEFLSWLLYILLTIVFILISALEFAHEAKIKYNADSQKWKDSSDAFARDVAPVITTWNSSANFTAVTRSVRVHPFAPTYTSIYLELNVPVSVIAAAADNTVTTTIETDRNALEITRAIKLGDETYTVGGCDNCNTTDVCIQNFGALASFNRMEADGTTVNCTAPTYTGRRCIVLQARKNDTGADIWWPDFELDGCEYPFTEAAAEEKKYIRTDDFVPVTITVNNDPQLQKELLSLGVDYPVKVTASYAGASDTPFKLEKLDKTPEAVGIALLALMMFVGSVIQGGKLIPYILQRRREGKQVFVSLDDRPEDEEEEPLVENDEEDDKKKPSDADEQEMKEVSRNE